MPKCLNTINRKTMKNIVNRNFVLKNKTYKMYFRTRLFKGSFHWIVDINEATQMNKLQAIKLLKELKHQENFEIVEVKKNGRK